MKSKIIRKMLNQSSIHLLNDPQLEIIRDLDLNNDYVS